MNDGSARPDLEAPHAPEQHVSLRRIPALLIIRGVLMSLVAIGLVGGLHFYLAHRIVGGLGGSGAVLWAGYALFALLFLAIPGGFAAGRRRPSVITRSVLWISHLWIGMFGLLITSIGGADLIRVIAELVTRTAIPWSAPWAAVSLAAGVGAAGYGIAVARGPARVRRRQIPIRDLGEGLRGARVVQISDIHIGQTLDGRFLQRIVDQVNALEPDLVAVTGDLVDGYVNAIRSEVAPLSGLRAKLGVFYVTGNHEYYYGGAAWEAEVKRLGLTTLHNAHRVVERDGAKLVVAGVTDHDGGHFGVEHECRPDVALAGAPEDVPRLLLAHQPRSALKVGQERVDLQLSGHTHGGQIFPFMFFVRLQQPVVSGFRVIAGVPVYTHNGTGYWGPPMRVGPAPEIAVLELTPSAS